ncbi:hypothetical protein F2Q70_00029818 [Brassica cretica]|nr:hypothetical protein F2Q70_00029818 [Brassica cretica]KAF3590176.1 hypothetical protein DY000_02022011 [Brassica cretica]
MNHGGEDMNRMNGTETVKMILKEEALPFYRRRIDIVSSHRCTDYGRRIVSMGILEAPLAVKSPRILQQARNPRKECRLHSFYWAG